MNWNALREACLTCTQCPLCQTRHNVAFGVGPEDAEVLAEDAAVAVEDAAE